MTKQNSKQCCEHTHDHSIDIYLFSPSGVLRKRKIFERGVRRLRKAGYSVGVDESVLLKYRGFFAGEHQQRVLAVHRAAESQARVALATRGGYGLNHLLEYLDYGKIAHAIDHGTYFVGFSDFTAFQLAVLAKTRRITWSGPMLMGDFGAVGQMDPITQACFEDVVSGVSEGTGWRLPKDSQQYQNLLLQNATLWGGNLAVLTSLLATPYLPKIEDGILFLEDIHEPPYRIERNLMQLYQAGVLQRQKAIILGRFTEGEPFSGDAGFKLKMVVEDMRARLPKVPILTGLPFGHIETKVCLPVGARVSLAVENREALLIWGHL